jgi:malate dehydrogenase
MTVCDTKPGLAAAFAEELRHVTASLGLNVEIGSCEKDEEVSGADIILISAGEPRAPGVKMSRRDLAAQNGRIIGHVAEATPPRNRGAKYIVISNPVDAMAMVCKRYSKAEFVISTGTNLESLRFRSRLAGMLKVPVSKVKGWVGGEHGDAAIALWSTVKIEDLPIDDYVRSKRKNLQKSEAESYMKSVSKLIVDNIGGTEYGPAASFRDIVRAIVRNTNEILAIAKPTKFSGIPEPVITSVPVHVGQSISSTLYDRLSDEEKRGIEESAKAIYETYLTAIQAIE